MNWYYVQGGQQAGPVDDGQLEELRRSGKVQEDTLIWCEGMPNWQPLKEAKPAGLRLAGSPAATSAVATEAATQEAVCAECGKIFDLQDTIAYGNVRVCAACKPIFLQKLAEGAKLGKGLNYASVGTRFGAVFLDGLILKVVGIIVGLAFGLGWSQAAGIRTNTSLRLQWGLISVQLLLAVGYEVLLIGKYGATLGKMACKIKVVTAEGGQVSYLRSLGRYFAKFLSGLICLIGYIMAAFDDERRALHDRICNTRVILK